MTSTDAKDSVAYLRSPKAIREQSQRLLERALAGESETFAVDLGQLGPCADLVARETKTNYPDLNIPYHSRWRHFSKARLAALDAKLAPLAADEAAKSRIELAIVSVLLDAGAGPTWRYQDPETNAAVGRSEGLALASFDMFMDGGFSSDPDAPLLVDLATLRTIGKKQLEPYFHVSAQNRLPALEGRLALLHRLEHAVVANKKIFGDSDPRLGNLYDYLVSHAGNGKVPARKVLSAILEGLGSIWPGRTSLGGANLGDVWRHPALPEGDMGHGLLPLHKLSQWLTYSLVEPLEEAGLEIGGLDELTGLAEYRNGGLLIDTGVLRLKAPALARDPHKADSPVIVEWRALTVALLDLLAERVRQGLGREPSDLPLAKILQGGTWSAGRKLAAKLREGAEPPLKLASDGTVF